MLKPSSRTLSISMALLLAISLAISSPACVTALPRAVTEARPDRYRYTLAHPHTHPSADRNSGSHQHTRADSNARSYN